MAADDYISWPQLIMRIIEKTTPGREADTNKDEGEVPKLDERFDSQKESLADKKVIAEFKFPINHEGRTFFYQQYSQTMTARQSTVNGIAGIVSEVYGEGISDVTMTGIFPTAAERNVIFSTALSFESALTQYSPRDWADNLKRFVKLYLDLHDPYSKIWTHDGYYEDISLNLEGLVSMFMGGSAESGKSKIGKGGTPNEEGYEFVVVDEYAKSIHTIQPKDFQIFASKETPLTYGWRLNASILEDKLDANYKQIPDDVLQLAASFRLPALSEIPVIGPLSTTLNKLIAINNAISEIMNTVLAYKNFKNQVVQDLVALTVSGNNVLHKIEKIAEF